MTRRSESRSLDPQFEITRTSHAQRELVFRAWSDPKYVAQWWGPRGFATSFCTIDFRVGGTFHYCMRSPEGRDYWNKGVYKDIVVPDRIISTIYFSDAAGNVVEPSEYGMEEFPSEMLDVVTFAALPGGKTKLTLQRNHAESLAKRFGEDQGWGESLDRLAALLSQVEEVGQ